MKTRILLTAAALLALGGLVGAAASQPSTAQTYGPGEWQAAGSYPSDAGGEVWMINTRTGAARNCYWRREYANEAPRLRCADVQ